MSLCTCLTNQCGWLTSVASEWNYKDMFLFTDPATPTEYVVNLEDEVCRGSMILRNVSTLLKLCR